MFPKDERPWETSPTAYLAFITSDGGRWTYKSSSASTISMQAQTSSQLYPTSSLSLPTFEFTKRKRWADLLITELTEAIILILSTQYQILYCSAAVKELLGWRDEDLIDTGFLDLVNGAWMCPVWCLTPPTFAAGLFISGRP